MDDKASIDDSANTPSPGPEDLLHPGDVLDAIGSQSGLEKLARRLSDTR